MDLFTYVVATCVFVSMLVSACFMLLQFILVKKWLAGFFDKQDQWLRSHFEELVNRLFR